MTQTQINMATLYERLSEIGFSEKFVREKALPDWWDEEFEAEPMAVVEATAYVSRRLNLDIASLVQPEAVPAFKQSCNAKFKTQQGTDSQQLIGRVICLEQLILRLIYTQGFDEVLEAV